MYLLLYRVHKDIPQLVEQLRDITGYHGKSREITGNHGKITGNHGKSRGATWGGTYKAFYLHTGLAEKTK